MKPRFWIVCAAWCAAACPPGVAASAPQPGFPETPEVVAGVGVLNVLNEDRRAAATVELRFKPVKWDLQPWVGALYSERQTGMVSAGLAWVEQTRSGFRFAVGSGPGYYHQGGGKDLGKALEFFSFVEVGWAFRDDAAVTLRFGHISNADLSRYNPGTEIAEVGCTLAWR